MARSDTVRVGLGVECGGRNGPRGGEPRGLGWRVGPGPVARWVWVIPGVGGGGAEIQKFSFREVDVRDSIPERVESAPCGRSPQGSMVSDNY